MRQPFSEPDEVTHISRGHIRRELHLDAQDTTIGTFDDEIDLAVASGEAKVADASLRRLCHHPNTKHYQRFEQWSGHMRTDWSEQRFCR